MSTPFRLPAATLFLGLILLEAFGYLTNPYIDIVVFVAVPVIFIAGLRRRALHGDRRILRSALPCAH